MKFAATIGQYYPGASIIHQLDPRTKLLAVLLLLILVFVANNPFSLGLLAIFLLSVIIAAKLPIKFIIRGLRSIMFIIIFTMLINLFFAGGENVLINFWFVAITKEAAVIAITMGMRLVLIIISSTILTLTTSPINLAAAMEKLLAPLKKVKLPVNEIAMMTTIALRFIPTLFEEADKITKAQMARGASFDTGGVIDRAKSMVPVIVPLFVSAFRRADELAMSMDSRCYRSDIERTKLKELKFTKKDCLTICVMLILSIFIIFLI